MTPQEQNDKEMRFLAAREDAYKTLGKEIISLVDGLHEYLTKLKEAQNT